MSLILDALRKAEAERKLGRAPTLATVSPWRVQRRVPLYGVVLIMLLGAAVVVAGVFWLVPRQAEPPPATAPATRPGSSEPAARAQTAPTARPTPAPRETTSAPSVDRAAPAPKPAPPKTQPTRPVPPSERLPTVVPNVPPVPHLEPDQTAPERPAPAAPAPTTPAQPRNVLPQLPKPDAAPSAPSTVTQPTPTQPPPAPAPAAPATLPAHVGPMSAAARTALGEPKLTLHYYNADPARRFVILDGERYGEGQATGKGLKVTEIRPDGLIGEYQGEFFFLSRGGG